ncbi:MAG TPA: MarR family transcriptional regulator [Bacillota bacterium]|jgi:DNA-binding MarR family transcriptional regulator|nr:MarR family transcriptional regulator [Bacillota bacterium]HOA35461.1 MarR family transcriptional regulator [Bacillota bacterium]HOJ85202.1 MarR family transcriptional regulator [Bacillota bacterium]HPZ12477.1 MarR family transcriptional regulator [Bacillota bacterium]HQE10687.1 MarR family transcriptional regulator [Bacillota bacterium]
MPDKVEAIAELVVLLPMFMKTLLEDSSIKTTAGLNASEKKTLMCICKDEGVTMSEYSKRLGLARGSFTAVADSLEKKGLVKRVSGSDDRRKCALILTKKGKRVAREIDTQFKQHIAASLARLSEADLNNLRQALETITATIEKLNKRGNC